MSFNVKTISQVFIRKLLMSLWNCSWLLNNIAHYYIIFMQKAWSKIRWKLVSSLILHILYILSSRLQQLNHFQSRWKLQCGRISGGQWMSVIVCFLCFDHTQGKLTMEGLCIGLDWKKTGFWLYVQLNLKWDCGFFSSLVPKT